MTDVDRAALAREIFQFANVPVLAADELTVKDYALINQISENAARRQLDRQVTLKLLATRLVWDERVGRNVTGYRMMGDGDNTGAIR